MIELKIVLYCSIIAVAYQILIRPGELLQLWARFVNLGIKNTMLQKLLLCPYCFGGQIALWSSLACFIKGYGVEVFLSVPCTIVIVYFVVVNNFKNG